MIAAIDDLLRGEGRHRVGVGRLPWVELAALIVACAGIYGAVMGAFDRFSAQILFAAVKVPLLLAFSTAVCLPFFFVMNHLLGLSEDFGAALGGILSAQGTLAVALAALAPITALFYASGADYPTALLLNALLFALASLAAQRTLARHYRPLIARRPEHRRALVAWFLLYAFVAIKVASVLRPFVGDPRFAVEFFRADAFRDDPYRSLFWTFVVLLNRLAELF